MANQRYRHSIADQPLYPHMKITAEEFPRVLATRIPKDDGDEYFGAFLNRTSVRILIDFLNRTFRLRTCTIPIDGNFPVPCTQYYARRCIAPCVANLCGREKYLDIVQLVRLFLRNDRELLMAELGRKIDAAAEALDFEEAAFFRDIAIAVEDYWSKARWNIWIEDAVDSFVLDQQDHVLYVIVVTQRQRRILGEAVYAFLLDAAEVALEVMRDVIAQFYRHHLPREIRVPFDFEGRLDLAKSLGQKLGRRTNIVVAKDTNRLITTERRIELAKARLRLETAAKKPTLKQTQEEFRRMFSLPAPPDRIEAFDAAHISATGFAAGVSVWQDGQETPAEYEHWVSDRTSELETLRAFVRLRLKHSNPDLIVIDGGVPHLNAAKSVVESLQTRPIVISAVKPRGRHSSISHFLTESGERVEFDVDSAACRILQRLRDEAHDLANATHRAGRDMLHFYELAAMLPSLAERDRQALMKEAGSIRSVAALDPARIESRVGREKAEAAIADIRRYQAGKSAPAVPLIVPIAYVEPESAADDLIPIATR